MSTLRRTVAVVITTSDYSCASSNKTLTLNFDVCPSLTPISSPRFLSLTALISPLTRIVRELSGDHIDVRIHREARSEDFLKDRQSKGDSPELPKEKQCGRKYLSLYESHLENEIFKIQEVIRLKEAAIPYDDQLHITRLLKQAQRVKLVSMTGDKVIKLEGNVLLLNDEFISALSRSTFSANDRITLASLYMFHELVHKVQNCSEKGVIVEMRETDEMLVKDIDIQADHVAACILRTSHPELSMRTLKDLQGRCLYLFPTTESHGEEARKRKVERLISLRMHYVLCDLGKIHPLEYAHFAFNSEKLCGVFDIHCGITKHFRSVTLAQHQYHHFSRALDPCGPEVFSERLRAIDAWIRDLLTSSL